MKQFLLFGFSLLVGMGAFIGCDSGEDLERLDNDNLTDTTGLIIPLDLFLSGTLDGSSFSLQMRKNAYFSTARASQNGYCDTFYTPDTTLIVSYIDVETMHFHVPTQRERSFYIDLTQCITVDSTYEEQLENKYQVGFYPYNNLTDSVGGAQIRYIDEFGETWSTFWGPNSGTLSFFKLNAFIPNTIDDRSTHIAFGEFSCILYNKEKDQQKEFRQGRYKLYLGKK